MKQALEDAKRRAALRRKSKPENEVGAVAEALLQEGREAAVEVPRAAQVGVKILRHLGRAVRRNILEELPRASASWAMHTKADTVVNRTVEFMTAELAAGDVHVFAGDAQAEEEGARRYAGFNRLRGVEDPDIRNAAALTVHGWALPILLYHSIHTGAYRKFYNFCAGSATEMQKHIDLVRDVWQRVRFHVNLLGDAINAGVLNREIPWHQHKPAYVRRLAKHGEFLERMLALQNITPLEGIGAKMPQLHEFDRRATEILHELTEILPTGEVEDPDISFWRNTEEWFKMLEFTTPRWVDWVLPVVQIGAIAVPLWLELTGDVVQHNHPALLRAEEMSRDAEAVLERERFNAEVAAELNAHPSRNELLGRMVYAQDNNAASKAYVPGVGYIGVATTSLAHDAQKSIRGERLNVPMYPNLLKVGDAEGLGRFIHANATEAGLFSQFTSIPLTILRKPKLWAACLGLLRARAELGTERTAEFAKAVATHGATLTLCADEVLEEVKLPADQHRITRAFIDYQVGAWMKGIHHAITMPEAWALQTLGYYVHEGLGDGLDDVLWWTNNALVFGTAANTALVTNYLIYWIGTSLFVPTENAKSFPAFVWHTMKAGVRAWWSLGAVGASLSLTIPTSYVAYQSWWYGLGPEAWLRMAWNVLMSPTHAMQALVTRVRSELEIRFPTVRGLRAMRESALRSWRVSGMDRVFRSMADRDPSLRADYAAADASLVNSIERPLVQNVGRVAEEIARLPPASGVPLKDFDAAMSHMHHALERYATVATTRAVVESATGAVVATFVVQSLGTVGAAVVTQQMLSSAYALAPAPVRRWRSYLGTSLMALPRLLYHGFARCASRRRAPARPPDEAAQVVYEGSLEMWEYGDRAINPVAAADRARDALSNFVEGERKVGKSDKDIDRELVRRGDPYVINMWRTEFANRGPPPAARLVRRRDIRGEIQQIVDSNLDMRVPRDEIHRILASNRDYVPYLDEFDEGVFG